MGFKDGLKGFYYRDEDGKLEEVKEDRRISEIPGEGFRGNLEEFSRF